MKINHHLQTKLLNAAENLCLAISYITLTLYSKMSEEEKPALEAMVASAIVLALDDDEVLSKDGSVKDADKLIFRATGYKVKVHKRKISSISELPDGKYSIVNYEYNGKNHWVGFYGSEAIYNSLDKSQCFSYGKPTDARILEFID